MAHLVTIAPGEVLGADVLVGVLSALLERRHVVPVLPVLVPQVVGVKATTDQAGDDGTIRIFISSVLCGSPHKGSSPPFRREKHIQDRQLAPQVCRAIESVRSTCGYSKPGKAVFQLSQAQLGSSRTAGGGGVVLDGSTLTVELVVDNPRGLGLGRVEAALGDRAGLLGGTLGEAGDVALGEHGGWLWGVQVVCWRGEEVEAGRTLKSEPL